MVKLFEIRVIAHIYMIVTLIVTFGSSFSIGKLILSLLVLFVN